MVIHPSSFVALDAKRPPDQLFTLWMRRLNREISNFDRGGWIYVFYEDDLLGGLFKNHWSIYCSSTNVPPSRDPYVAVESGIWKNLPSLAIHKQSMRSNILGEGALSISISVLARLRTMPTSSDICVADALASASKRNRVISTVLNLRLSAEISYLAITG
ncbi:hypothetical protein F5878DRAFT_702030 [Lentinula raphanica]|uniref:Uncharacterized protein n=1 Tax=Lentinula raphanica TaxID=153919 RepID=A0AA38UBP7_9AGAR|nr:hypothetical protein F5878DRAFT_702030 [Lentinula raphanica]